MKKLITCLDVRDGKLTKGVQFLDNKDLGDPVEAAKKYCADGIDEIVLYDFSATHEKRGIRLDTVKAVAAVTTVPFGVGGGIKTLEDFQAAIDAGAKKVHINSAAVRDPSIIGAAAVEFGEKAVVLSIDVRQVERTPIIPTGYEVVVDGGRTPMGLCVAEWARRGVVLGAGEVVVNSIDTDGTRGGFAIDATRAVADMVPSVPVVASGGGGTIQHIYDVLTDGGATSALVASMLHFGDISVKQIKDTLVKMGLSL